MFQRNHEADQRTGRDGRTQALAIAISQREYDALTEALSVLARAQPVLDYAAQLRRAVTNSKQLRRNVVELVAMAKVSAQM